MRRGFVPFMSCERSTSTRFITTSCRARKFLFCAKPVDDYHRPTLERLESIIGGRVILKGQEFFRSNEQGELDFSLLAEGRRKLGLLWLLIRNGTLRGWVGAFLGRAGGEPEPQDVQGRD